MPASQLKRLKASLREQGITGQQKSKKQKIAHNARPTSEKVERTAALQQIRDSFNPFELRQAKPAKFATANAKTRYKDVLHRPGVSKGAGEQMRRANLLPEMQRRNKIGGVIDRRIGEGDVDMTPEEKAAQRYARAQRKGGLFNLDASDDEGDLLTHGGRGIAELEADDFDESEEDLLQPRPVTKDLEEEEGPARKKSRKEIMEEVVAKSKFHKYERQKAKEDDDDLREELDKEMGDLMTLLQPRPTKVAASPAAITLAGEPHVNPDRQRLLDGEDRKKADKEYDTRLRQLAGDTRAQPSDRTKTDVERAAVEAEKTLALEKSRDKRMRGEESEEEHDPQGDEDVIDEATAFGFQGAPEKPVHEDEDDFELDDDLIASESEGSMSGSEVSEDDYEEDEFVATAGNKTLAIACPRSHEELLKAIEDLSTEDLPKYVQNVRAAYHSSLAASNKDAIADFSAALVDHISYMAGKAPLPIIEQIIRHLHSLSRTYPTEIAEAFRTHLRAFEASAGDLIVLTAIGSIYPTSDHFHQVVTPAITVIAKYLALAPPSTTGTYLSRLALHYQRLSKRYVPELVRYAHRSGDTSSVMAMAELWKEKSAFVQIFRPFVPMLSGDDSKILQSMLDDACRRTRPLQLHNHRPLPVRSSIPKFEEGFNPDRHYDPDKERSEARKLQKEYQREKKGALRELRKDANFMAREQLREKKERDAAYEKKYKRLVAEIQGEEGHEAKEYEREKKARKRARNH